MNDSDRKKYYCFDIILQLATKLSEVVLDWVDEGLDVNRFHVIGHGLGGMLSIVIY